ncbi:hypothetical protein FHX42_000042 [Saccharopolyspora lacisalsi]|uniref:Uncharacterized protein n=1 Tax=Halosaccharopolyspora lacisalsi TaxID=1000566 RepID=A0A839DNS4_9PSEU|nr:hypothetical protein [Halosaccharopolyspora lacisalsi]MBA8822713.1 hypothetical protein [Halosaccharopolyspora lacisalsi]
MSTPRVETLVGVRRVPVVTARPDDVGFRAKLSALRAFRALHAQTAGFTALEATPRQRLRADAERHGLGADRLAETFQLVDTA